MTPRHRTTFNKLISLGHYCCSEFHPYWVTTLQACGSECTMYMYLSNLMTYNTPPLYHQQYIPRNKFEINVTGRLMFIHTPKLPVQKKKM